VGAEGGGGTVEGGKEKVKITGSKNRSNTQSMGAHPEGNNREKKSTMVMNKRETVEEERDRI